MQTKPSFQSLLLLHRSQSLRPSTQNSLMSDKFINLYPSVCSAQRSVNSTFMKRGCQEYTTVKLF